MTLVCLGHVKSLTESFSLATVSDSQGLACSEPEPVYTSINYSQIHSRLVAEFSHLPLSSMAFCVLTEVGLEILCSGSVNVVKCGCVINQHPARIPEETFAR